VANRLNWQIITPDANVSYFNIYRSIIGVESANDAPFSLSNNMLLVVEINGIEYTVVFNEGDFQNISAATAQEVVDVISNQIPEALCHVGISGSVFIRGEESVKVSGGSSNSVFGFPLTAFTEKSNFLKITQVPSNTGVIEHVDIDGRVNDWYKVSAVDDTNVESALTKEKQAGSGRNPVCLVFGKLQNGSGYPMPDQEIKAVVEYPPTVDGVTTTWVTKDEAKVLSLRDGTFEIELLQNATYNVTIPSIEFARTVKIPPLAQANLFSLEFEDKSLPTSGDEYNF